MEDRQYCSQYQIGFENEILEIGKINTDLSENVLVRYYLGVILKIGAN